MSLRLVPVSFADACAFVAAHHRHHQPPVGHKFSVGVAVGDVLVGVAMVGRPVARHFDDGLTLEVNRTATDGTANANSKLWVDTASRARQHRRDGESPCVACRDAERLEKAERKERAS